MYSLKNTLSKLKHADLVSGWETVSVETDGNIEMVLVVRTPVQLDGIAPDFNAAAFDRLTVPVAEAFRANPGVCDRVGFVKSE